MSLDIESRGEPVTGPAASEPRAKAAPKGRYPVAKPATVSPKIDASHPDPEQADLVEDLLSPSSLQSFAWSIGGHAILLLILGLWYFVPIKSVTQVFDTRLAGSPFGDESGDQLKGGLGMDTPLAMPEVPNAPTLNEVAPTFTALSVPDPAAPPTQTRPRSEVGAANGGGVNLSNPGAGGGGDGFGVAKFGQGGEKINGVDIKVGDPQFTLIWDSRADIDLHVVEPGGSEIYWENRAGGQGGELDVDDVDGFGPENVNYVQGRGPRGTYTWFVRYYGGMGGMVQPTKWKVRVKHGGKVDVYQGKLLSIGAKSQEYKLQLTEGGEPRRAEPPAAKERERAELPAVTIVPRVTQPPPTAPTGPVVFAPAGAGFSVKLPGEPKVGRKDWDTPLGAAVGSMFMLDQSDGGVTITTLDFPAATVAKADPGKLLDDMAVKAVAETKGTATKTTKIALNGSAGREVEFTVPDSVVGGGGFGRARVYLVGPRIVIASVVGTKGFLEGDVAVDMLKSLQLDASR